MATRKALATWAVPTVERIPLPTHKTYARGIDWIAVERATLGDRVELTWGEQQEVALAMVRAGRSEKEAAACAGTSPRQVARWKFDAGLGGASACTRDDCSDQVKGRGLCDNHYRQDARDRAAKGSAARSHPHEQKRVKREPVECGTREGFAKHIRRKNKICQPCRDANAAPVEPHRSTYAEAA